MREQRACIAAVQRRSTATHHWRHAMRHFFLSLNARLVTVCVARCCRRHSHEKEKEKSSTYHCHWLCVCVWARARSRSNGFERCDRRRRRQTIRMRIGGSDDGSDDGMACIVHDGAPNMCAFTNINTSRGDDDQWRQRTTSVSAII